MSELKLKGTIKLIGEKQTFDSGFQKVEFVVTTEDQYPQDVKFEIVQDKCDDFLQHLKEELMDAILYIEKLQTQNNGSK